MVVEVEDALLLGHEVRILAGLPGLGGLPRHTRLAQNLPGGLGTHSDPHASGEVADQLGKAPRRKRQSQLCGLARSDAADLFTGGRTELTGSAAAAFGDNAANPWALNAWITSRTYPSVAANIPAISPMDRPCTEDSTIPARRNRTRSFAGRVIFTNRCASSGPNDRTNTSGLRATSLTSSGKPRRSPTTMSTRHHYNVNVS